MSYFMILSILSPAIFLFFDGRAAHPRKIPSIPSGKNVKIEMTIEPCDNTKTTRWLWEAYFVVDGERTDLQANGIVKDEYKAWERAREAADDARARYAAEQMKLFDERVRQGKKRTDVLPL